MKKAVTFIVVCICCFVAACNSNAQKKNEDELSFLEVDLSILPEQAEVNENVLFQAVVTYGDAPVTDADEVEFEIWHEQAAETEKIAVEHSQDGIYKLEKTFTEEGTYYVYAHVTAEDLHTMPKKEFVIVNQQN